MIILETTLKVFGMIVFFWATDLAFSNAIDHATDRRIGKALLWTALMACGISVLIELFSSF